MKKTIPLLRAAVALYGVWLIWVFLSETFAYGLGGVQLQDFQTYDIFLVMGALLVYIALRLQNFLSVTRLLFPCAVLIASAAYILIIISEAYLAAAEPLSAIFNDPVFVAWFLTPLALTLWLWSVVKKGKK